MDEFLKSEQENENTAETEEIIVENSVEEPLYNPVTYTDIVPVNDYKPMNKGLKIFSLILVAIIILSSVCLGGYYIGKSQKKPVVGLETIPANTQELSASKIYDEVNESIVGINIYNSSGVGSQATGIIYSKNGYIITNDHIYSGVSNPKFKIYTFDGKEYDAKYVAGDLVSDLAILKVEGADFKPATFGNSDDLYIGQNVVAIGRPTDATDKSSITSGIISALNRRIKNSSNYSARLIQTDSPINPGSSGGALVNMYGQIVGITSSKLASVEYEGMGYAIPTTVMKRVVDELISDGKVVSRAKLGVTYVAVDSVTAEINGFEHIGLLIQSVTNASDLFGKVSEGDTIIKINDISITSDDTVLDIIEGCTAGDKITVTVVTTENKTKTFTVELRANVGESSYNTAENSTQSSEQYSGGTFDFPFGE